MLVRASASQGRWGPVPRRDGLLGHLSWTVCWRSQSGAGVHIAIRRLSSGAVAQLVAHLHGMEGVRGSSPLSSTAWPCAHDGMARMRAIALKPPLAPTLFGRRNG